MGMQILGPVPRPAESETLGVEPTLCISIALQVILGHAKVWGPLRDNLQLQPVPEKATSLPLHYSHSGHWYLS